jgi:hypothetical protein
MKESLEVKVKNLMAVDAEEKGKMALELMGQTDIFNDAEDSKNLTEADPEKRTSKLQFL